MREYVVLLTYEHGVHPVRDIFIDYPDLVATALAISSTPETGWRVERITGPEAALDALETVYLDPAICNECVYPHPKCDAESTYEVLEAEPTTRTIYRSTTEQSFCSAVSVLAVETLGAGLVFDATQRGPHYEWRLMIPSNRDLGAFHDALESLRPDGVSLTVRRVGQLERWREGHRGQATDLPFKQREALETAIRLGYYAYPREAKLEDVAAELDLPVTTLRYRLRRAEAWAVVGAQATSLLGGEPSDLPRPAAISASLSGDDIS